MKKFFLVLLSVWAFQVNATIHIQFIDPFSGTVGLKNFYGFTVDFSQFRLSTNGIDTPLSKLKINIGNIQVPGNNIVVFTGFPLDYKKGYLSLHNTKGDTFALNQKESLLDFVQWGDSLQGYALQADSNGYWKKGDFLPVLNTFSAYIFTGVWPDYGKKFWQVLKMPQIVLRFAFVSVKNGVFGIKNPTATNVDAAMFTICVNGNCYDSLKNAPWVVKKGSLDILKDDTLWLSGVPLDTNGGSLALFFPMNQKDTANMLDFVQWNKGSMGFHELAHRKSIWDSTQFATFTGDDSLVYTGDFTRMKSGHTYWEARKKANPNQNNPVSAVPSFQCLPFPNPADDFIRLSLTESGLKSIRILDMQGRTLFSVLTYQEQFQIETSDFANGLYTIDVQQGNQSYSARLQVLHE